MTTSPSPVRKASWLTAFAAAAALHGGTVYWLLVEHEAPGAAAAGQGGIEVSMASGAAAGAQPTSPPLEREVLPEATETAELEEVTPEEAVPEEVQPDVPPEETAPELVEQTPPDAVPPPETPAEAVEVPPEPVEPEAVPTENAELVPEEVTPVEPVPEPPAEPAEPVVAEPVEPPPPAPALPTAKPEPPPRPEPVQQAEAQPEPPEPEGNRRAGGTQLDPNTGDATQSSQSAGGSPGVSDNYQAQIMAWLQRYKRYPERAQRRRIEGTALLRFTLAPNGEVLDYALERSSGSDELDEEVIRMIQRASPLPAMPADQVVSRLEMSVPVTFALR
ncbi:energy transducer TonB family protein [Marinivivus vitaminiproducens]|uniref:energy transducer TonB family protein n=1 Tax=Marinivivus vitaminiproducens TaxID=3035935 RepID=UPI00279FD872|nr:energy transducer TonB [Geminicoccaceae bacterium SCSIO 64248]